MFQNGREKNRNEWVSAQYDKAESLYRERIATIHMLQDFMDYMQTLPRWRFLSGRYSHANAYTRKVYCGMIWADPTWPDVYINTYNIPIETVINDICGPIHRTFGVDWTMEPQSDGDVWLKTRIKPEYSKHYFVVNVIIGDGIPKCNIVKEVKKHTYDNIIYRIKCS